MRKDLEKGAIVVEATISLTAFIFAIFTILSVVNIAFIQAKIGVSLSAAAKEISQYSYLYYAFGVNNLDASISAGTQDSKKLATDTIDGVGTFMSSLSGASNSAQSGDFEGMVNSINNGVDNVNSLATQYADAIKDDPKAFILGMGKMAANELKEEGKVVLAQVLAKTFMQKNLMSNPNDDADAFLRRNRVVDGMDGLDFNYTTFLANGTSNLVQLVVTYDVKVLQLLNIDFTFTIRQCSKTTAWGNGISILQPSRNYASTVTGENLWHSKNVVGRGETIVATEKEKYTYTDSGHGFDAYDNSSGKNEFITITSVDTDLPSYQTADGMKGKLKEEYNKLYNGASGLGEQIQVQNSSGETVTLTSNPESRTYRVVLVIPDDADMGTVTEAVRQFKADNPDVEVSVRQGYGTSKDKPVENSK